MNIDQRLFKIYEEVLERLELMDGTEWDGAIDELQELLDSKLIIDWYVDEDSELLVCATKKTFYRLSIDENGFNPSIDLIDYDEYIQTYDEAWGLSVFIDKYNLL